MSENASGGFSFRSVFYSGFGVARGGRRLYARIPVPEGRMKRFRKFSVAQREFCGPSFFCGEFKTVGAGGGAARALSRLYYAARKFFAGFSPFRSFGMGAVRALGSFRQRADFTVKRLGGIFFRERFFRAFVLMRRREGSVRTRVFICAGGLRAAVLKITAFRKESGG